MNRLRMHMNIQIHFHCLLLCICNDHAIWNLKVFNVNLNIIVAVLFRIFLFVRKNTHRPFSPPRPITWQRASRFFQRLPHFGRTSSLFCQISRSCDLTASWKAPGSVCRHPKNSLGCDKHKAPGSRLSILIIPLCNLFFFFIAL